MRASLLWTMALFAACAVSFMPGCSRSDARSETNVIATIPVVTFEPKDAPRVAVTVEIARTPAQVQRGLMFRRTLAKDHGMLFLMGEERVHSFWMRNTYISLDMIFIGKDMTVAGIVPNTTPQTDTSRYVDRPSLYVLEVNAGWAAKHHVTAGTPVRFEHVD